MKIKKLFKILIYQLTLRSSCNNGTQWIRKSTLSKILAGHPSYQVNGGEIVFDEKDLLDLSPEQRSHEGLFLAFQHPIEISGVTNYDFLRIAYNEKQKYLKKPELDPLEFMTLTQTF